MILKSSGCIFGRNDTFCFHLKQSYSNSHELLTLTLIAFSTMVAWHIRFILAVLLTADGFVFSKK